MAGYKLTKQAVEDIENILRYTKEAWGFEQAEKYGYQIFKIFEEISEVPLLGSKANYIFDGIRKIPVEKHIIFYIVKSKSIVILRVLHASMDVDDRGFDV